MALLEGIMVALEKLNLRLESWRYEIYPDQLKRRQIRPGQSCTKGQGALIIRMPR